MNEKPIIIGVIGERKSGKKSFCNLFSNLFECSAFYTLDTVFAVLLEGGRFNKELNEALREKFSPPYYPNSDCCRGDIWIERIALSAKRDRTKLEEITNIIDPFLVKEINEILKLVLTWDTNPPRIFLINFSSIFYPKELLKLCDYKIAMLHSTHNFSKECVLFSNSIQYYEDAEDIISLNKSAEEYKSESDFVVYDFPRLIYQEQKQKCFEIFKNICFND